MSAAPIIFHVETEFEFKSLANDDIVLGGYMSTKDLDYAGDICPADSWDELLDIYGGVKGNPKEPGNPIYCLEHDRHPLTGIIGLTGHAYTDSTGLVFDDVILTKDIPYVRDVILPNIRSGALKQQSVGFRSLDKHFDAKAGITYHRKNLILEGSIVSVACNRHCFTRIKSLDDSLDLNNLNLLDMRKAYEDGKLEMPAKQHFVPEGMPVTKKTDLDENTSQNSKQAMIVATKHMSARLDQGGAPIDKPTRKSADFDSVAEQLHLAVRETGETKAYLFQVAVPTEKGFSYDFDLMAKAVCQVMGARNGDQGLEAADKLVLLKRLKEAYDVLEKEFPKYHRSDKPLSDMAEWQIKDIGFKEVDFSEGEKDVFQKYQIAKCVDEIKSALKTYGDNVPEDVVKSIYGMVDINLYASMYNSESLVFVCDILRQVAEYNKPDSDEYAFGYAKWLDGSDTKYGKIVAKEDAKVTVQPYDVEGEDGKYVPKGAAVILDGVEYVQTESLERLNLLKSIASRVEADASKVMETLQPLEAPVQKAVLSDFAKNFLSIVQED